MRHIKTLFLLLIGLLGSFVSSAQFVTHDTIQIPTRTDSLKIKFLHVPDDAIFIPAYYLYNHNWNNDNVKTHRYDYWLHEDTTVIIFNKDTGTFFSCPFPGKVISPFGKRGRRIHSGVDIKLNLNDAVRCAFPGVVRVAKKYHGYGNMVVVRHYNGLETLYGHLNKMLVKPDQVLKAGDLIGLGGRTGRATCTHLHFETRFLEDAFDPQTVIDFASCTLKSDTLIITSSTFSRTKYFAGKSKKKQTQLGKGKKHPKDKVSPAPKEETPEPQTPVQPKKSTVTMYTIRNGDTFYKLARKFGTTVDAICKLNNFTKTKVLHPGQKIKIK